MRRLVLIIASAGLLTASAAHAAEVRIKDLGRFQGWRDNPLVGYGVVLGLAGSGDSPRSEVTRQALKNVLGRLGANVDQAQLQSRNVAAVIVTATLPPSAHAGDKIDVTVSSIGDARSLAGGTLLMTPLQGPDQKAYALAQGPVVVGGYRFDSNQNLQQKNYPASGVLSAGATVETPIEASLLNREGGLTFILKTADVTTAQRVADSINASLGYVARVDGPEAISIGLTPDADLYRTIARIEGLSVSPDSLARLVINERSGTVVAGSGVWISSVVISQGDIKVSVTNDNQVSQPTFYSGDGDGVRSLVVTNTRIEVASRDDAVVRFPSTTVGDLVEGLRRAHVSTREVISILQAIKAAGALHADIIVQ